jgi:DNA-binding response OmpR family regulator
VKEGYEVEVYENGDLLYQAFITRPADLIILDVMMPGSSGLDICRDLRRISSVPIIMLTAKDTEADYVAGITLGSDDYFTKPVSPTMLTMRVKAILRRIELDKKIEQTDTLIYQDITIHPQRMAAFCHDAELPLTMTEFRLLSYLFENSGKAVPREELLNKIWGYENVVETRVTDDTVKRIRRKLTEYGSMTTIETVWGFGFKLGMKEGER